jgi:hypothetical protein
MTWLWRWFRRWRYDRYMRSTAWREKRIEALARAGWRCQRCRRLATEVHHVTYARLGHEWPDDLEALCDTCHPVADRERAAADRYQARLAGWSKAVFGDDWRRDPGEWYSAKLFDVWLAKRGER